MKLTQSSVSDWEDAVKMLDAPQLSPVSPGSSDHRHSLVCAELVGSDKVKAQTPNISCVLTETSSYQS